MKVPSLTVIASTFASAKVKDGPGQDSAAEVAKACSDANMQTYTYLSTITGLPPVLLAALHYREAACDFADSIQDGHTLPKSRKWLDDATSVIRAQTKKNGFPKTTADALLFAEKWNGLGYAQKGMLSPYVWARTNYQTPGKFIKDGVFSQNTLDRQIGVAAFFIEAAKLGLTVEGVPAPTVPQAPAKQEPAPVTTDSPVDETVMLSGMINNFKIVGNLLGPKLPAQYQPFVIVLGKIMDDLKTLLDQHATAPADLEAMHFLATSSAESLLTTIQK